MRPRDVERLASTAYDVLVIGGGIHGLTCAYDAASRGLRVALVEAGDFGGATSFNHQKTVHGGLRSLQSASLGRARESIRERRALARIAPWLLRPLPFLLGTYRSATRSRLALRTAFAMDKWLGRHRNDGLEPELHLPPARLLSRTATRKLFPGIRENGLTGGAQWYDYQMVENDRLTFAVAAAADRAGADLASYAEARAPLRQGGRLGGLRVHDRETGTDFDVQARAIVNAAGARAGEVMAMLGVTRPFPLIKALNLVTAKPATDIALAAPDAHGRMLTLVPWRGRAIVGTGQGTTIETTPTARISSEDVERLIAAANHAFPALQLTIGDVTLVHRGLVPAVAGRGGSAEFLAESRILDHASDGADGAVTVAGAKYTTARAVAERVATGLGRKLRRTLAPSRTAILSLPCAGIADHEALAIETGRRVGVTVDAPVLRHLVGRYAEGAAEIVKLIAERPGAAERLVPDAPAIAAEIVYVIRHEAALHLPDILLRRTAIGAAGHPGGACVTAAARIAAAELGWEGGRIDREIRDVDAAYRLSDEAISA